MIVILNGKNITVADETTLATLLAQEHIDTANTAIAVDVVVSRSCWAEYTLKDNSRILLIKATQGG